MNLAAEFTLQIYIRDDKLATAYRDIRKRACLEARIVREIEKIIEDEDSVKRDDRSVFLLGSSR